MINLKSSVKLDCITPQMTVGLIIAYSIFNRFELDMTVTSANDSVHGKNSKHPKGDAIDIRTKDIQSRVTKFAIITLLKKACDKQFDIVFESEGKPQEHIHMEYDPK